MMLRIFCTAQVNANPKVWSMEEKTDIELHDISPAAGDVIADNVISSPPVRHVMSRAVNASASSLTRPVSVASIHCSETPMPNTVQTTAVLHNLCGYSSHFSALVQVYLQSIYRMHVQVFFLSYGMYL